ncbi:unnamed protein product [Soboliphyme baturini]|uniref:Uncharacterized protein n=1 Tax=Soboliphyme baturini TaxID=241478 RepID=A0A183IYT9_9BILA|nr:unnamed protein product [Soboliphyme baturini]
MLENESQPMIEVNVQENLESIPVELTLVEKQLPWLVDWEVQSSADEVFEPEVRSCLDVYRPGADDQLHRRENFEMELQRDPRFKAMPESTGVSSLYIEPLREENITIAEVSMTPDDQPAITGSPEGAADQLIRDGYAKSSADS